MTIASPDLDFVPDDERGDDRAKERSARFRQLDPFPSIPPALLSSAEIEDYVRVTAMLHPFYPVREYLKSASYEARPGRKFVRWDENGTRFEEVIRRGQKYELPPNSISYMQIESKIRLPDYIALRFNLRIKHVHRGLLLGTGPLVDPGFSGDLLIPLHNLTSDAYEIDGDEGLIWIEFTKTSLRVQKADPEYVRRGNFNPIEQRKTDVPAETYFQKANSNKPVKSSIPEAIRRSEERAKAALSAALQSRTEAEGAAKSALEAGGAARAAESATRRQTYWYAGISGLAIVVGVIALHQYFAQIQANVETTQALAATINTNATEAKTEAMRAMADVNQLRSDAVAAMKQIDTLRQQNADNQLFRAELESTKRQIDALQQQLKAAATALEELRQSGVRGTEAR
jgi:deoxycytidine triphosphate deaminase